MPARSPLNQPDTPPDWVVKMQLIAADIVGSKHGLTGPDVIEILGDFQRTMDTIQSQIQKEQSHVSAKAVDAMEEMWRNSGQTPAAAKEKAKEEGILGSSDEIDQRAEEWRNALGIAEKGLPGEPDLLPDPDEEPLTDSEDPPPDPEDDGVVPGSTRIPRPKPIKDNPQA